MKASASKNWFKFCNGGTERAGSGFSIIKIVRGCYFFAHDMQSTSFLDELKHFFISCFWSDMQISLWKCCIIENSMVAAVLQSASIWQRIRATFVLQHHCGCVITPQSCIVTPVTGVSFAGFQCRPQHQVALMKKVPVASNVMTPKFPSSTDFLHHQPLMPPYFCATPHLVFLPVGAGVEIQNAPCRNIKRTLMKPKSKVQRPKSECAM